MSNLTFRDSFRVPTAKRDLAILVGFVALVGGGVYWNEAYNLANPEMEAKLVGCWAGSTHDKAIFVSGAVLLEITADGRFSQTGTERTLLPLKQPPRFVSARGTWTLHRDHLTLKYYESNATTLLPRAGKSLKLIVEEVTPDAIIARTDYDLSQPYRLGRAAPADGECRPRL
jgi:hypothetical protein